MLAAPLVIAGTGVWWARGGAQETAGPELGPVRQIGSTSAAGRLPTEKSIAVLPFAEMSPERDHEYFGDGIAEELLSALAQVEGLKMAARTSSFSFKEKDRTIREIGEELGVRTVLEGSLRKSGDRVRIAAQLIDAKGGFHCGARCSTADHTVRESPLLTQKLAT